MPRWSFASILMLAVCASGSIAQPGDTDLAKALALERSMQKIIQQNEPSIVCILVSRSDAYQEFGQGPDVNQPGKLGAFDLALLRNNARYKALTLEKQRAWEQTLDFNDPAYVPRAFGSGVVIDPKGLILTNYHVVQDATKVFVRLPGGQSSYADVHAADSRCDLAVLRLLNTDAAPLKTVPLGDADKMQRGQFILTLSNPFAAGFRDGQPSASWGLLSNIRRKSFPHLKEEDRIKPFHAYGTLLQTDARLNLGCSGGAMFNLSGEMVGLITSIAAIQGGETPGGFAVPVNAAMRRIIDVLKRGEELDYGFLGVSFNPNNGTGQFGVMLKEVSKGSPAHAAKLMPGDVLVAVNGQPIHDNDDVYTSVGIHVAGSKVSVRYRRKGVEHVTDVTLAKLYVPSKNIASSLGSRPYRRGLRVDNASLVAQKPDRPFGYVPAGVLVIDVQPGSSAEKANVKTGDIITHVNGIPIATPAAFYQGEADARGPIELSLYGIPNKLVVK